MTMIDAHSKTPAKENGVGVFSHVLFWVDMRPHSPLDAFVHVPKSRGLARFFSAASRFTSFMEPRR